MTHENPFIVGKYLSPEYFCDREEETAFMRKQMLNGRNVALVSPRRLGKTGYGTQKPHRVLLRGRAIDAGR